MACDYKEPNLFVEGTECPEITWQVKRNKEGLVAMVNKTITVTH